MKSLSLLTCKLCSAFVREGQTALSLFTRSAEEDTHSVCVFGSFLPVARIHSLAFYRGPVIVFRAVIEREGSVSSSFSGGTLANLGRSSLTACPFLGLVSSVRARAFHSIAELAERGSLTALNVLGKVCLWQSKQRWQALQKVLQLVSDLEKKKEHVFCCRVYTSDIN